MIVLPPEMTLLLSAMVLASVAAMHLSRKNAGAVALYMLQSAAVLALFFAEIAAHITFFALLVATAMLLTKIIAAPYFFYRLIRKHRLTFSASTHLSAPLSFMLLSLIIAASYSKLYGTFALLAPLSPLPLFLASAGIFVALFVVVNRKGALSQMLGVLALENSIIAFAVLAGLEQSPMLELGIVFDIFIWIMIATVFVSMIYQKFGSLDSTAMAHLKEE